MSNHYIINAIEKLPSIHEITRQLQPKKYLGQNFLLNERLCHSIIDAIPHDIINSDSLILEIGPGTGGLTRALLAVGYSHIEAVEIDKDMIKILKPLKDISDGRLNLINVDAMLLPIPQKPFYIVGNLPFYIATALWLKWLQCAKHILGMVLMFQAEIGNRLIARPHSKNYNQLSIISQYLFVIEPWLPIKGNQFWPTPKVNVLVIRARPHSDIDKRLSCFISVSQWTKLAFSQPRKTLRKVLSKRIKNHLDVLNQAGIDPSHRAANLTVDDFLALANIYPL